MTKLRYILDLKDEISALKARWPKTADGRRVVQFQPATLGWNPLDAVRLGTPNEIGDAHRLAALLAMDVGEDEPTTIQLLVGLILHALYQRALEGTPATLAIIERTLSNRVRLPITLWLEMASYAHRDGRTHPAVDAAAREQMRRNDEDAARVLKAARSCLMRFRDPIGEQRIADRRCLA